MGTADYWGLKKNTIFAPVLKRLFLQIVSFVLALQVLLVAHGLCVNFHLCVDDHHVFSSFGDASELCVHCVGHHHHEHLDADTFDEHNKEVHFGAKCCCEDFDSEIGFTDNFTFSSEKNLSVFLPFTLLTQAANDLLKEKPLTVFRAFDQLKIPYLLTGRLKTIFFSSLRINPTVA